MRILIVGATGTIGRAVSESLRSAHEVLGASRRGEVRVSLDDTDSIARMYREVGKVDAVVCAAGQAAIAPFADLSETDFLMGLRNKLLGQMNLVRLGVRHLNDEGSFTLTSGLWGRDPMPGATAIAPANAGIEAFARAAALELPRGLRINVVSPPLVRETAVKMGWGNDGLSAAAVAASYLQLITGKQTGVTLFPGD